MNYAVRRLLFWLMKDGDDGREALAADRLIDHTELNSVRRIERNELSGMVLQGGARSSSSPTTALSWQALTNGDGEQ